MSRLNKILVAYDGSPHSKEALNWAINLSILSGAQVMVVKVMDAIQATLYPVDEPAGPRFEKALEKMRQEDQRLVDEAVATAQNCGVKVTGVILQGNIAEAILDYAKKGNFDLIVAGTKGRGVLEGLLMGSVTQKLVSLSSIPIFVVKE
jgi:nucleotide-binding universal stress UspA family protein